MRYLGGKMRQSKVIVAAIRRLRPNFRFYVEPFCGGMWSACAVIRAFPDRQFLLSDCHPHLVRTWEAGRCGWDPPSVVSEATYNRLKANRPDDPMTGYAGFAWSFGGKFFGGLARNSANGTREGKGSFKSTMLKIETLRAADVTITCSEYAEVPVPLGSVLYVDPPYEGRTHQSRISEGFDYDSYYAWVEKQAKRCTLVLATSFTNPRNWEVVYNYGNTVTKHVGSGYRRDQTEELLLRVKKRV